MALAGLPDGEIQWECIRHEFMSVAAAAAVANGKVVLMQSLFVAPKITPAKTALFMGAIIYERKFLGWA